MMIRRWLIIPPGSRGFLKQVGIDSEANSDGPAQDLVGGLPDRVGERVLQPILKEQVGHADRQRVLFQAKFRVAFEPKVKSWLSDTPGDILAQRRHDVTVARRQGFLPAGS
jgi:hypothetical protein